MTITFIVLLQIVLIPIFYAVLAKAAAFVLRRKQLRWLHAFVFGVLVFLAGLAGMVLKQVIGMQIPLLLMLLIGLAAFLVVGGWYLGPRVTTVEGATIQFKGGMLVSLMTYGFVAVLGVVVAVIVPLLNHTR